MASVKITRLLLSVLLLLCILQMPYDYYQIVRYVGMIGLAYLSYYNYTLKNIKYSILFATFALLINPFAGLKIHLSKMTWNIIDIIIVVFIILNALLESRKK